MSTSFFSTEREADTEHAGSEDDQEEGAERYRQAGKRREHYQHTEENKHTGPRHKESISGLYDDDKLAADGGGGRGEMYEKFLWRSRNHFFVDLGELASYRNVRDIQRLKFFKELQDTMWGFVEDYWGILTR